MDKKRIAKKIIQNLITKELESQKTPEVYLPHILKELLEYNGSKKRKDLVKIACIDVFETNNGYALIKWTDIKTNKLWK